MQRETWSSRFAVEMQRLGSEDYWIDLYHHGSRVWGHTAGEVLPELAASSARESKPDLRPSRWRLPWRSKK